jgi:hypothetical protein
MGLLDLFFRESGISLEQKGTDFVSPQQINDFLMRENRVRERTTAAHEDDQKKCCRTDSTQAHISQEEGYAARRYGQLSHG